MMRSVRRLSSAICCFVYAMAAVFVVSSAPATAATVLEPDTTTVSTSPAVNVKYIHGAIKNLWEIDIPYSPELKSDQYAVNMRYLLGMVDIANARLGGRAKGYPTDLTGAITFNSTKNLAGIGGSLGEVFPTLADGSQPKFAQTFKDCTNLTGNIPEDLFAGVSGAPVTAMFYDMFSGCKGLSGDIPAKLFSGISGAPVDYVFFNTFNGCTGLTGSIPENLFAGISGKPAIYMFAGAFSGCTGLTGTIPENLFAGISGAPAGHMFENTFGGLTGVTGTIPENLFVGVVGAPADNMFSNTFSRCTGLTGTIPANLFTGISGRPASAMFWNTFSGDTGLSGIGGALFAGISGAPAQFMFFNTFNGCKGLTGSIPVGLFGNLSGGSAEYMFQSTFENCAGLTGEIPLGLFGNLSGSSANSMFGSTFSGCSGLTGNSAQNPDGTPLYDVFPTATSAETGNMYRGTCFDDNDSIPDAWGKNASCVPPEPDYPFTVTVETRSGEDYDFYISAAGTFYVNWGDGSKYEKIVKADTSKQTIRHTYSAKGTYTVKLGGLATAYPTGVAAVDFADGPDGYIDDYYLTEITGSLGKIFPTLADGSQPNFYRTFWYCTQLKSIPAELFDGVHGAPVAGMFRDTFYNCPKLTKIPTGLFSGISGAPAESMFAGTFYACSGLTGEIPLGLFGNLSGSPAEYMFQSTFAYCSGLTGASARNPDGTPLYDVFPTATTDQVGDMYDGATGLSDYDEIPADWK